jgi:methionyl aminopeptidase
MRRSALLLRQARACRTGSSPRNSVTAARARRGFSELLSIKQGSKSPDDGRELLKEGQYEIRGPGEVPAQVPLPSWAQSGNMPPWDNRPQVHTPENLIKMRAACKLAADILNMAGTMVTPGVTTEEIDQAVHRAAIEAGAYPSPLNYGGFPKSVCTSVNECICHGIPDLRPLKEGDIVNIDVTVFLNGYHGDTSRMFKVGRVSETASTLCKATTEALMAGIEVCAPGVRFAEIGSAIQKVADSYGYASSKSFVGHGVGTVFHAYPHILHYRNNEPGVMKPGMTFTIEPMLCEKSAKEVFWKDGWTAVTKDAGLSAQQEHTILITDDGCEILTLSQ